MPSHRYRTSCPARSVAGPCGVIRCGPHLTGSAPTLTAIRTSTSCLPSWPSVAGAHRAAKPVMVRTVPAPHRTGTNDEPEPTQLGLTVRRVGGLLEGAAME